MTTKMRTVKGIASIDPLAQLSCRIVCIIFLQPAEEHTFTATFFLKAVVLVPGQQSSATVQPATVCVPAQATLVHSLNFA